MRCSVLEIKQILLPTDFSELATRALQYASQLAETCRAHLHFLHVVMPFAGVAVTPIATAGAGISDVYLPYTEANVVEQKTQELKGYIREHLESGTETAVLAVRRGVPWEEIVHYAAAKQIDLVVMGTHGRGVMHRILIGSTSKAVVEHSSAPVLLVPAAAAAAEQPHEISGATEPARA